MAHWMQVKTSTQVQMPSVRSGHAMCSVGQSIYLFGGYEHPKYLNDLWKLDLPTLKFSQIEQKGQIPPPCSNFTMNIKQDQSKIYLFGGMTLNDKKLNGVYEFNIATLNWQKLTVSFDQQQPKNRSHHCSEIIDNYLVVFGGQHYYELNDLWLFDIQKRSWIQVPMDYNKKKPQSRKLASSLQYKNRFYVFGGCKAKYESLSDCYCLDLTQFLQTKLLEDMNWQQLKFNRNQGICRWGHTSVVKDSKAYIFGGRHNDKDVQNLLVIDLVSQKCHEVYIIGDFPKGRMKPAVCLRKNTLFCHSGFDGHFSNDFFQINLLTKPKYNHKEYFSQQLQAQKNNNQTTMQSQLKYQIIYDNSALKFIKPELRERRRKIKPRVAKLLTTKLFAAFVSPLKILKNNQYFQLLRSRPFLEQQFKVYRPEIATDEQYLELLQIFILYLRAGKIVFNQQSIQDSNNKLIKGLLELADYYGIHHLQYIIKQQLLNNFQKHLRSKRGDLKKLVEKAFELSKYDHQLGQYAGFHTLLKLIKRSNTKNVDQLRQKLKNIAHLIKQTPWLLQFIEAYQFELQQYALNKSKLQSQNNFPQLNEDINNQRDNALPHHQGHFFPYIE